MVITKPFASWLAFVAALAVFAPGAALAHKTSVRRTLFLEPAGERELHVLLGIRVPAGDARRAIELYADQNHDGVLQVPEVKGLENLLASRALDGLHLYAGTSTLALSSVEVKSKTEPRDAPLEVMLHAVAALPPGAGAKQLAVGTGALGDPLELVVLAGTRKVIASSRGRLTAGSLKVEMGQGDRVSWHTE